MKNHHQAIPASIDAYRERTKAQLYLDHRRKTCYCGKVISSKTLARYGSCEACYEKAKNAVEAA